MTPNEPIVKMTKGHYQGLVASVACLQTDMFAEYLSSPMRWYLPCQHTRRVQLSGYSVSACWRSECTLHGLAYL